MSVTFDFDFALNVMGVVFLLVPSIPNDEPDFFLLGEVDTCLDVVGPSDFN
jgi:hypothetical protein